MSAKKILKLILFITLVFQVVLDDELIDYEKNEIKDMRTFLWNTKSEKFYYLGNVIEDNLKVIAFSDLNNDKLTDIIAYKQDGTSFTFYAFYYTKKSKDDDEKPKFIKDSNELFTIEAPEGATMRNLHIGSFFKEKKSDIVCYLVSFNNKDNQSLAHYIVCNDEKDKKRELGITSNILIMNKNKDYQTRLLFYDSKSENKKRKICKLVDNEKNGYCEYEDFNLNTSCSDGKGTKYLDKPISLNGGLAFVDLDGDCIPDIVLTHEEDDKRIIEIYTSSRINRGEDKYCLSNEITLDDALNLGALTITKINDDKSEDYAPLLDIIVPYVHNNTVKVLKNKKKVPYDWSHDYCKKDYNKEENDNDLFNTSLALESLSVPLEGYTNITMDSNYPTVIRVGDFLASSNPGIIVKFNALYNGKPTSIISLFKREEEKFQYYMSIEMEKIKDKIENDEFEMGLFFDIDESGTLSVIIPTKKTTYFFFNYKRDIFFLKSKLMNQQKYWYDVNVGVTYRYIVTSKKGDRHMDISQQLSQTSDTNIPLPYSLIGLDDTNNYVEYFQTISGSVLDIQDNDDFREKTFENTEERDWKSNTPIIPNTQMMIFKFYNTKNKIEWNVDLIVQPMEQIWIFLIVVIVVLIIVLIVIIILHFKEVKEEQKETNKFKSWFA